MAKGRKRWNIGTYSRFIKAARLRDKITVQQARVLYRELRSEYGRSLFPSDYRKPGFREVAKDTVTRIRQTEREIRAAVAGEVAEEYGAVTGAPSGVIQTLEQWEEMYDALDEDFDYEYDMYEGTAEYGETI